MLTRYGLLLSLESRGTLKSIALKVKELSWYKEIGLMRRLCSGPLACVTRLLVDYVIDLYLWRTPSTIFYPIYFMVPQSLKRAH